jgi:hypothetical protein
MQQTQAMLEQKRLALKFGLPQYLGFSKQMEALSKFSFDRLAQNGPHCT